MSLFNTVHSHYSELPEWMIRAMGAVYYTLPRSKRYSRNYSVTEKELCKTEYMSQDEIENRINERFLHTVRNAFEHVPYYRKRWREEGIDIQAIKDIRDIVLLPTIDKEELRNHCNELISEKVDVSNLMYVTTSGSTGNPVGFYQPKGMLMTEWAYVMHIWRRVGCTPESSRLVLRGKPIHPNHIDPNWFYDPLRRELSIDIFNMTDENMERYCQAIERYKPEFVHGYMSAIQMLSKYIEKRGGLEHRFKAVLATSENVLPEQKEYVEKVCGARVFSFYGHSERLVIAGSCEKSDAYHVEPMYGYAELLDKDGQTALCGELVATGFLNEAMPLIRYRTGDLAEWEEGKVCSCGRFHARLKGVYGRWHQDMLVTDEGATCIFNSFEYSF